MQPIADYTTADWLRLRPLTHWIKTTRYRVVDAMYRRRSARVGDAAALSSSLRGRRVLITVAFSDPQAIEWQACLVRKYVPHAAYIVADNSPDDASAAAIAAIAEREGFPYLRLPRNPWPSPSRSHGIAL